MKIISAQHVATQIVPTEIKQPTDRIVPLFPTDYSEMGLIRRWFNQFCDWLRSFMTEVHMAGTTQLRGELEEGYREIADHRDRMKAKYPDAYEAAEKELRKRYIHLD